MTEQELDLIEVRRSAFELDRIDGIEGASVVVNIQGGLPFHATTYARNMLTAKILVLDETTTYIDLYGREVILTKDEALSVLKAVVDRQDYFWQEYFNNVKALYG